MISTVSDWAGLLCEELENFTLHDAFGLPLHPGNPIEDGSMIYMVDSNKMLSLLLAHSEFPLRGFAWSDNKNNDTLDYLFKVLDQNKESSKPARAGGTQMSRIGL